MYKIIIFTIEDCVHCLNLKNRLNQLSIPYEEIDVDLNPDIWKEVCSQTNEDSVPTIFIIKNDEDIGTLYVPGVDYDTEDEIIDILLTHI